MTDSKLAVWSYAWPWCVPQCVSVPEHMAVVPCGHKWTLSIPKENLKANASDLKGLHKEHSTKEAVQGHKPVPSCFRQGPPIPQFSAAAPQALFVLKTGKTNSQMEPLP